ncbi:FtsX-like permease family protein, partial [Clostridiaceae bacterium HSG29]|nr:FtsX-like permease family protein [Clostridiaceae bacterium HSG29]
SPRMNVVGDIIMNIDDTSVALKGAIKETLESEDLTLINGRFLNDFDINSNKRNIVISSDLSETINKKVGDGILIKARKITYSYNIVGIYESQSSLGGFEQESIYIPYTTINYMSNLGGRVGSIQIDFVDDIDFEKAKIDVINVLERTNRNVGEDLYKTFSADDMIDNISNALGQMTLFITAIAGISLLVGGIGIMNIMLVSVTERTREIGTRKAVGAKYKDIMLQFLIESTVISLIGGLLGAIFGIIITNIAGKMMSISSVFSIEALVVAFVFSSLIGLFFGIYPANKAAKLNPIDALRYE